MHSSLAQKHMDYEVDFVDCQRLERALEKLSLSLEVLRQIEHIAYTLQSSMDRGKSLRHHASDCVVRDSHEISLHINKIRGFKETGLALQNRAERASGLVSSPGLVQDNSLKLTVLVNKAFGLSKNGLTPYKYEDPRSIRYRGGFTKKGLEKHPGRNSSGLPKNESNDVYRNYTSASKFISSQYIFSGAQYL